MKATKTNYPIILMMPFGVALSAIAIMLERMADNNDTMDFIIGMLFGLSVVANIVYIILASRNIAAKARSGREENS
ncbi:MAG: hypothetical protein WCM76_10750 [Bacteroidota bacterium]